MRSSNKASLLLAVSLLSLSGATIGCGANAPSSEPATAGDELGSVGVDLTLSSGATINTATYTITGPNGFSKTGPIDVSASTTISAVISGIPAGTGFSITISATSTDGATACTGSAGFDVAARTTSPVAVHLTCTERPRNGSIKVTGTLNTCPLIDGITATPAEVTVGHSVTLSIAAHDSDASPGPLTYQTTATSGTLTGATGSAPTFTCTAPGPATITVTVSDGDPSCSDQMSASVVCSLPGTGSAGGVLTLAVYGDAPYGTTPTDTSETNATPAFISAVNADPAVRGVIHVGDIHSGKQFCTEAYDRQIFGLWQAFQDPLVYTPGDNEWSDCHKAAEGGGTYNASSGTISYVLDSSGNPVDYASGDPVANLSLVRSIFFAHPGQALGGAKEVLSQAAYFDPSHPTDGSYVENVMWEDSGVLFVTVNLPGGSNNDADVWYGAPTATAAQTTEISQRTGADLRWLDAAFSQAEATNAVGVVIVWQADVWDPEKGASHQTGYEPFVQNVASHTNALGKPVLMLNGDSHVYQSGNPFSPTDPNYSMHPGYTVPNFHRIVVHGSTTPLEYLRLTIDPNAHASEGPDAFGPFSWTRVIQ